MAVPAAGMAVASQVLSTVAEVVRTLAGTRTVIAGGLSLAVLRLAVTRRGVWVWACAGVLLAAPTTTGRQTGGRAPRPDSRSCPRTSAEPGSPGIAVLRDEAAPLGGPGNGRPDRRLHVVGLGPKLAGKVDVHQALADVPEEAPRVVVMHNPTA